MSIRINDIVPNFKAETDQGPIQFHDWIGDSWAILFSHPKDYTPVCTTELGSVAQLKKEWAARNTKVIGLSVDNADDHKGWKKDIEDFAKTEASFPIIADQSLEVSKLFDMLPADAYLPDGRTAADSQSVRSVFIISPDKKLQLSLTYPMTVGRNFAEILRALKALQITSDAPIATPADWQEGDDVIIKPSLDDAAAKEKFGDFDAKLPYLRFISMK
jgi:alkyl hydroperoxide reductase subunit AhpC